MEAGLAARLVVFVVFVAAYALWVAGEDAGPEAGLVLLAVPALPCCAAALLCLTPVLWAAPALVGVLGAAGLTADAPACTSGHASLPLALFSRVKGVVDDEPVRTAVIVLDGSSLWSAGAVGFFGAGVVADEVADGGDVEDVGHGPSSRL
jgi:hypothetical protein